MPVRFQVDPDFYDHPKVIDLSDAAVALWTRAGSYCAGKLTDGFVPDSILHRLSDTPKESAAELVRAKMWRRVRGGHQFHEYGQRNLTKAVVDEHRERDRARKQAARMKDQSSTSDHRGTNEGASSDIVGRNGKGGQEPGTAAVEGQSAQVNGHSVRADSERNPDGIPDDSERVVSVSVSVSPSSSEVREEGTESNARESEPRGPSLRLDVVKVAKLYTSKVKPSDMNKVCMAITNATATYDLDQIAPAIELLAKERRPVTADTLRIALQDVGATDKTGTTWYREGRREANGILRGAAGQIVGGGGNGNGPRWYGE